MIRDLQNFMFEILWFLLKIKKTEKTFFFSLGFKEQRSLESFSGNIGTTLSAK